MLTGALASIVPYARALNFVHVIGEQFAPLLPRGALLFACAIREKWKVLQLAPTKNSTSHIVVHIALLIVRRALAFFVP